VTSSWFFILQLSQGARSSKHQIDFRRGRFVECVLSHTVLGVLTHPTSEVQ